MWFIHNFNIFLNTLLETGRHFRNIQKFMLELLKLMPKYFQIRREKSFIGKSLKNSKIFLRVALKNIQIFCFYREAKFPAHSGFQLISKGVIINTNHLFNCKIYLSIFLFFLSHSPFSLSEKYIIRSGFKSIKKAKRKTQKKRKKKENPLLRNQSLWKCEESPWMPLYQRGQPVSGCPLSHLPT